MGFRFFLLAFTILCCLAPNSTIAYMTLFNGDGDWTLGVRGEKEDKNISYRACKNSLDRNEDKESEGSVAIMCITVAPAKKEASLGIWHSESLGSPGENIPCGIALDNNAPVYGYCRLEQTKFGKSGFVLLDSENAIRDLLKHDRVKVLAGKANSKSSDWQTIEFKIRQQSLRNKAKPVYEYFK